MKTDDVDCSALTRKDDEDGWCGLPRSRSQRRTMVVYVER